MNYKHPFTRVSKYWRVCDIMKVGITEFRVYQPPPCVVIGDGLKNKSETKVRSFKLDEYHWEFHLKDEGIMISLVTVLLVKWKEKELPCCILEKLWTKNATRYGFQNSQASYESIA